MASYLPAASSGGPPHSVESIARTAQNYEYNSSIPLKNWLRSAATLSKEVRFVIIIIIIVRIDTSRYTDSLQARVYEREGHDEQAYLLLFRHAQLILVNLAHHPEVKNEEHREALAAAEKEVKRGIEKMEVLRPRIKKRYETYTRLTRERQSRQPSAAHDGRGGSPAAADPVLSRVSEPLEAGENRELAVELARGEMGRRATARRATREGEQNNIRRTAGIWDNAGQTPGADSDDLSRRIQDVRRNMEDRGSRIQPSSGALKETSGSSPAYRYPCVPPLKPLDAVSPSKAYNESREARPAPQLPPKERLFSSTNADIPPPPPPPRPEKELNPYQVGPSTEEEKESGKLASVDRQDLDPASYTFKPSAYLENGTPLRSVFISANLRHSFVSIAARNTHGNRETCGILCGALVSNAFFVSKLLIPEQTSTSDTCETTDESAIFDYCESEDLIVLGWIHTHPTQTCFMSSRDLHTHCGYQVMLPESIAIVCAPSKMPDFGVFRLTDPPGLRTVLDCKQTGLFHPHHEKNVYTDALRPGHVYEVSGLEFETVDMRHPTRR